MMREVRRVWAAAMTGTLGDLVGRWARFGGQGGRLGRNGTSWGGPRPHRENSGLDVVHSVHALILF